MKECFKKIYAFSEPVMTLYYNVEAMNFTKTWNLTQTHRTYVILAKMVKEKWKCHVTASGWRIRRFNVQVQVCSQVVSRVVSRVGEMIWAFFELCKCWVDIEHLPLGESIYIACIWWECMVAFAELPVFSSNTHGTYSIQYISPREQASVSNTGPLSIPQYCRTDSTSLSRSLFVLDALLSSTSTRRYEENDMYVFLLYHLDNCVDLV